MTQPGTSLNELDGALGVLPPSAGALFAVVGVSSKGPVDTPAAYATVPSLIADFGAGPMVEAAAHFISQYGGAVVVVRTTAGTDGSVGAVDLTERTGTSVVTADAAVDPIDDFEVQVKVILGGTIGTGPITFQWSLDDGRTWSAKTSLGTAVTFTLPATAPSGTPAPGVKLDFAAGTLVTGDIIRVRTVAPDWNSTNIGTALDALAASALTWRDAFIVGNIIAGDFDAIEAKFVAMHAAGKYHGWMGGVRVPDVGESEATYSTSLSTAFAAKTTVLGELCAGAQEMVSAISGRRYMRSSAFVVCPREASVDEQVNIAAIRRGQGGGPLPCSIRDEDGNPKHHDESINPGLDDLRFTVLRTWTGRPGVFVNRPRVFSSETSDFQLMAHRRVMNLAKRIVRSELEEILNSPIRVNRDTGRILETEAQAIETVVRAKLDAALVPGPKASGSSFVLSRTDNILATKTLNYQVRVIPLGYAEFITGDIAFENPALQVQAVA